MGLFDDVPVAQPQQGSAPPPAPSPDEATVPSGHGLFGDLPKQQAAPTEAGKPSDLSLAFSPSEVGHNIYKTGASILEGINAGLNPFSEEHEEAVKRVAEGNPLAGLGTTGGALLSAATSPLQMLASPVRSVFGHLFSAISGAPFDEEQRQALIKEAQNISDPRERENRLHFLSLGTGEGTVDTALGLIAPRSAELPGLGGFEGPVRPVGTPPGKGDVALSPGQQTGDLPTIQKEQAAHSGILGEPAQRVAKEFFDVQQPAQVDEKTAKILQSLDPNRQEVAMSPVEAGQVVKEKLSDAEQARAAASATEAERLRPKNLAHPHDAADVVGQTLRGTAEAGVRAQQSNEAALQADREGLRSSLTPTGQVLARNPMEAGDIISGAVTRAEEQATQVRDDLYKQARASTETIQPKRLLNVGDKVNRAFNDPKDPFILNDKTTPNALSAISDLDKEISEPAAVAADPNTKSFKPFTMERIDNVRKRLGAYWRAANNAARGSNDFSDVSAMSRVIDTFDDIISGALKGSGARQALSDWEAARAAHAELRKNFSYQGKGDVVGPVMNKIVGQREGQAMPGGQIAKLITSDSNQGVLFGRRLNTLFGENSPEIGAARQANLSAAIEPAEGMAPFSNTKIADNLDKLRSGELGRTYFTQAQRDAMRQHAVDLRNSVAPEAPKTDVVSRQLGQITGIGGQPATSAELSAKLFGNQGLGESADGVKIAQHVADTYGRDSEAFRALRSGQFSSLTRGWNKGSFDHAAAADRIDKFLNGPGKSMADVLYSPEEQRTFGTYRDALRKHVDSAALPKDPVDRWIARVTGRDGGNGLTSREVADDLYGSSLARDKNMLVARAQRLKKEFGENTPQWSAVKQGLFQQLVESPKRLTTADQRDFSHGQIADRIAQFFNNAPELARTMFSPEEQAAIRGLGELHRKLVIPQGGKNWSNTASPVVNAARVTGRWIARGVAAVVAEHLFPMGGAAGAAAIGTAMALTRMSEPLREARVANREARKLASTLPMIGDQISKWQNAVATASRLNSPPTRNAAAIATTGLSNSLRSIGLDLRSLIAAGATQEEEDKRKGGPQQQNKNGGDVQTPTRAHGGSVDDSSERHPLIPSARKAKDGHFYAPDPERPGKYVRITRATGGKVTMLDKANGQVLGPHNASDFPPIVHELTQQRKHGGRVLTKVTKKDHMGRMVEFEKTHLDHENKVTRKIVTKIIGRDKKGRITEFERSEA